MGPGRAGASAPRSFPTGPSDLSRRSALPPVTVVQPRIAQGSQGPPRFQPGCAVPEISLVEWILYCCTGKLPAAVCEALARGGFLADLVRFNALVGTLQPKCAERPGVCDPVLVVDKQVHVPPATLEDDGSVTPSEVRLISYCAPINRALVVAESRVTAANLTGASQPSTMPVYKRVNLATFGEWCLPFEPADMAGQFANVENVIVPPGAGYSVYVQNLDPTSEAAFHLHSRMWACC